jgi:3-hydroxy-5-methyl-1-naphthoate 3-O-methyltransferase
MDFGDGSGVYAIQVVKANPNMKATVLDLGADARWLNNISRALI